MSNSHMCHGKYYPSTTALAKAYGMSRQKLQARLDKGITPEEAVSDTDPVSKKNCCRETIVDEHKYRTFKEACEDANIPESTIQSRLKSMNINDAFKYKKNEHPLMGIPVVVLNESFKTEKEACEKYELNYKTVHSYMKRHEISFEKALLHYLPDFED